MTRLAAFVTPGRSLDEAVERVIVAERLGYESVFDNHIAARDGLMLLAAYGQATTRIKLGTGVLPCFPRHPVSLAIEAATLDELIGGRLILGIGPSHKITMENWYDIPMEKPFTQMKEYVEILRQTFTQGSAQFSGEFYKTSYAFMGYSARADLPIMVSALAPNMLRWAGEKTEGTILWSCLPSYIRSTVTPLINEGAKAAGRAPGDVEILAAVPTALTTNVEAAHEVFRKGFMTYMMLPFYRRAIAEAGYEAELEAFDKAMAAGDQPGTLAAMSDRMVGEFAAIGDAAAIRDKIAEYRDAGATLPALGVIPAHDGFAGFEATLEAAIG